MKRTVLIFGLLLGLVVSTFMAISMLSMRNNPSPNIGAGSMIVGYLSMIIAFSLIYVAIKNYRNRQLGGTISFGKALSLGLLITLVAATMYVVTWAVIYHFFMPNFMDQYAKCMLDQAAATATPAELDQKRAELARYKELYKSPLFFTLLTYMEIVPVGIVVSLITALLLKRKNRQVALA